MPSVEARQMAFVTSASCWRGTAFGVDVVPDVRSRRTTSAGRVPAVLRRRGTGVAREWSMPRSSMPAGCGSASAGGWVAGAGAGAGVSVKSPGVRAPVAEAVCTLTDPIAAAARCRPSALTPSKRTTCFASSCCSADAASACVMAGSSGAAVHCAAIVRKATAATQHGKPQARKAACKCFCWDY